MAESGERPAEEPTTADLERAVADVERLGQSLLENVSSVIIGKDQEIRHVLSALFGGGHVIFEDVPGVGKSMLARAVATSIEGSYRRIQFTPELTPADVTGSNVYNQRENAFEFRRGPVFTNVLLCDEINRSPPKTQSALLEAMAENQVTVDGETRPLPRPFLVIATRNTIEGTHTYGLPMAQLDRFMKQIHLGYPTASEEVSIVESVIGTHPIEELEPTTSLAALRSAQKTVSALQLETSIREYATQLVRHTREQCALGASPRATIDLLRAAQGRAAINGRWYVVPDDVQTEAVEVLAHRIRPGPNCESAEQVIREALSEVPVE